MARPRKAGVLPPYIATSGARRARRASPRSKRSIRWNGPRSPPKLDMRINSNKAGIDFVTSFADWINDINGCVPTAKLTAAGPFFCHTGRDLSQYVHVDVLFQAYFVACLNLLANNYPGDDGNPYGKSIDHTGTGVPLPSGFTGALADIGFGTFGAPAILTLVCKVASRALKHQWYQ